MTGLLYSEGLVVSQTFKVGDILLLDSQRVLWGQTPFRAGSGWLSACEGGFFSRDEALSRTHLLRRLMNNTREFDL